MKNLKTTMLFTLLAAFILITACEDEFLIKEPQAALSGPA